MHLTLILGNMFAGKTTELLKHRRGKTLIINHEKDTRTGDSVRTHDGVVVPAVKCSEIKVDGAYDTVLIDEGQFFDSLEGVEKLAERVVVAGLSGDYLQRPFGQILSLIPKAAKVIFLQASCYKCGCEAPFTKRLSDEVDVYSVEAKYVPACTICY